MPLSHLSFEFFPPQTEKGLNKLHQTAASLQTLNPEYFSVTYGAGGSLHDKTKDTVYALQSHGTTAVTPHISCIGTHTALIQSLIQEYQLHHINRLITIRGDIPSGMRGTSEFAHADELISCIRRLSGNHFHITVACYPESHPESFNTQEDFKCFLNKVKAGANAAVTQYFYNADAYFYFVEKCHKANVSIPIIPGILPITNYHRLARFSTLCGAELPRWIRKNLETYAHDLNALKAFGIETVTHLCQQLIEGGAPGLHFYTLNDATASLAICQNLATN
jgi:methylenetetrahydrofolate reductase (NADPH)